MKNKHIYLWTIILSLIIIAGSNYKIRLDHEKRLKTEEVLQASDKLQQIYYVLNGYLNKIDVFSKSYLEEYLPERTLICSTKEKNTGRFKQTLDDLVTEKIKPLDYELDFFSNVIESMDLTEVYTQDLKTPSELKAEKIGDYPMPLNYQRYVNSNARSEKYMNKESWNTKLMEPIHFGFKECVMSSDDLAKHYNKYNAMLKNDIKNSMKKIENFYKKNNLNLSDLKTEKP